MVDYSPLWDTMQKRKITQYTLLKDKRSLTIIRLTGSKKAKI